MDSHYIATVRSAFANKLYYCYYERSELSGLFNGTDFLYNYIIIYIHVCIFQALRRAVNVVKYNVSIYVYLNIRPMRYSAMQI